MTHPTTALVIGGGIAGPVAATALQRAGIRAHVYEAHTGPTETIGGSLALAANGLAALDLIGAGDAVRAIGQPIAASRTTMGGREVARFPVLPGVEPMRMVDRNRLHRTLHRAAEEAGAEFTFGARLAGVEETADGVIARFADGSEAHGDVLVGADGVRSTVRGLIDPANPGPAFTGLLSFEGHVEDPGDGFAGMTFAFGSRAYYLYWPEADGRVGWGANLPSARYLSLSEARETPQEDWLRILRDLYAGDDPGERLTAGTTTLDVTGAIHIMPPVPHWHRDRMVLVGDAVHAPSNSTGQGASLAIESAIELARCLRDLPDPGRAFDAYVRLRRERVEGITRRGARLNATKTPGPVARAAMRLALPLFFRLMNPEKTLGPELRFRIDWDARVTG